VPLSRLGEHRHARTRRDETRSVAAGYHTHPSDSKAIDRCESAARSFERRHSRPCRLSRSSDTNAGRPLFNLLTRADAEASNALFVTLDPLIRQVRLPDSRELLVSDTVGFIDRLPHALVAAFRATLEETADADLVLHVIDAAASDRDRRMNAVRSVLQEVGALDVPMIEVYNKCDALTPDERRRLQDQDPGALSISALTRTGIDELVETIASRLALDVVRVTLTFDPDSAADRERIARVYRHARVVLHETRDAEISMVADVPRRLLNRLG
jgi:GTP-binding protein HflX